MKVVPKITGYCWWLDATAIAHFDTFEEAVEALEKAPARIAIWMGDVCDFVDKDAISIAPLEV